MKGQPHQDRTTSATVLAKCHGLRYQTRLTGPTKSTSQGRQNPKPIRTDI